MKNTQLNKKTLPFQRLLHGDYHNICQVQSELVIDDYNCASCIGLFFL